MEQDIQEIDNLIIDISITLEETDRANLTLYACQTGLQKNLHKLKYLITELKDMKLATKYNKQVSDMLLASLINHRQVELKQLMEQHDE